MKKTSSPQPKAPKGKQQDYKSNQIAARAALLFRTEAIPMLDGATFDADIRKFKRTYRAHGLPGNDFIQEFKTRAWIDGKTNE